MTVKTLCNLTEDTKIHVKYVKSEDPVITDFTATPGFGTAPLTVTFSVSAYDPDEELQSTSDTVCHTAVLNREIRQYLWDFNNDGITDLTTRDGQANHTFSFPGIYQSTVTVVDNEMTMVKSQPITITVTKTRTIYAPVNLTAELEGIWEASLWAINNNDFPTEITLTAENENGDILQTETVNLNAFGKLMLPYDHFNEADYDALKVVSNQKLILYGDMSTDTGSFTAYIGSNLYRTLIAPHIAEETEQWTTKCFLANTEKRIIDMVVNGVETELESQASYLINLSEVSTAQNKIAEDSNFFASFDAPPLDPFGNYAVLTGFEYFSLIEGDTAGTELIGKFEKQLFIPYIPRESEQFWAGFTLVNTENTEAEVQIVFYSFKGEMLGNYILNINANTKKKILIGDNFPEVNGLASWAIITSNREIAGIEIFGSFKEETSGGGICGFGLNGNTAKEGVLPFVSCSDNQWTGVAITNINSEATTVKLQLTASDGTVKETVIAYIDGFSQYKGLVKDIFENSTPELGDFIKFSCNVEVLAAEIGGENDWSKMKALNFTK
jgi:PKD repeat protein